VRATAAQAAHPGDPHGWPRRYPVIARAGASSGGRWGHRPRRATAAGWSSRPGWRDQAANGRSTGPRGTTGDTIGEGEEVRRRRHSRGPTW